MESKSTPINHGTIFSLLVIFVFSSVGLSLLHLSPLLNNLGIFGIATIMAGLVVFQYMGLSLEGPLVVWLVIIPSVLFVILVFLLMPDIAHVRVDFIRKI